jgi:ribonucleoside-diphosphate reductase alpha chain
VVSCLRISFRSLSVKKDFDRAAHSPRTACASPEELAASGRPSLQQVRQRVAGALAREPAQKARFLQAQGDGLVCGHRVTAVAGTVAGATLLEGFVQPVEDTTTGRIGGVPGIMEALVEAVETIRHGAALTCDFSRLRPLGAQMLEAAAEASGPLACMQVLARACEAWGAGSSGCRGALGAVLRVDHPDIERFLDAIAVPDLRARGPQHLTVGITDDFLHAVESDATFHLVHVAQPWFAAPQMQCADRVARAIYRTVPARELWQRILRSAHAFGEPGLVYVDRLEQGNNLWYCEQLAAGSPCGGPPLPFYAGCCPAGVDLTRFVRLPFSPRARFRHAAFAQVIATGVELLDRVLDVTHWPLSQQAAQARAKRRIALGCFGLAEAMAMLGMRPGSPASLQFATQVARTLRDAAYRASVRLAASLGSFPLFEPDAYLDPQAFSSTLPQDIQDGIRKCGIRNSHLLWMPPSRSECLHAPPDGASAAGPGNNVAPQDQLSLLGAMAPCIDCGIAAAITLPASYSSAQVGELCLQAWHLGLKGCRILQEHA